MPGVVTWRGEERADLTVHVIEGARALGVDAFVTTRFGGVSTGPYASLNLGDHVGDDPGAVERNRQRVARAIGRELTIVRQVHGARVRYAHEVTTASEADALVTRGDEAIAILVADCVPILLASDREEIVGVVHAGWRGLAAGVVEATLAHFRTPRDVHAFIGPHVSPATYQVGPEVAERFRDVPGALRPDVADRFRLDLACVATTRLRDAGLRPTNVSRSEQVTDGGEVYFSDRAERPCGRFALVARRRS